MITLRVWANALATIPCENSIQALAEFPESYDDGTISFDFEYVESGGTSPVCSVGKQGWMRDAGSTGTTFTINVNTQGSETEPQRWSVFLANISDIFSLGDFGGQGSPLACYPDTAECPAPGAEEDFVIDYNDLRIIAYAQSVGSGDCGFLPILDTNGNGTIDYENELGLYICNSMADLNGDFFLDFFDYDVFVAAFESGDCLADVDMNGFLDFFDYDLYIRAFQSSDCSLGNRVGC
ncbi:MAG: hypothetical protein HEQ23_00275 [Tepidisphaera sp.]